MYEFRDTTAASGAASLPTEALKLNGAYLEDQVDGYRTLYVKGRELLAPDVESYETGVRDGATLQSRRYPARTIVVGYQLLAADAAAFRAAYNALNEALNVEEAELIFRDEPDKFFVGTPSAVEEVEPGTNSVTGEFELLCTDPFKYSVEEYEVTPSLDDGTAFAVDYHGTCQSYPTLEADFAQEEEAGDGGLTGSGDCGFVVFMDSRGSVIQLGDPDETDGETYPKSQTLVNQVFNAWGPTAAGKWKLNAGRISDLSLHTQAGSVKLAAAGGEKYLTADSFGAPAEGAGGWHGPSITRSIPADAAGDTGAADWRVTWRQRIGLGIGTDVGQRLGVFQCQLVNAEDAANKKYVAGIALWKGAVGSNAELRFYVNGKVAGSNVPFSLLYRQNNLPHATGSNPAQSGRSGDDMTGYIEKKGSRITFSIGGVERSVTDPAAASLKVHELTFWFGQYRSKPALNANGLYWVKFIKDACTTYRDIPNKFSAGDSVVVDCRDGSIRLNDLPAPELGALGNDYERFCLTPGLNQVGAAWSDWSDPAPSLKLRYREVFL